MKFCLERKFTTNKNSKYKLTTYQLIHHKHINSPQNIFFATITNIKAENDLKVIKNFNSPIFWKIMSTFLISTFSPSTFRIHIYRNAQLSLNVRARVPNLCVHRNKSKNKTQRPPKSPASLPSAPSDWENERKIC